MNKIRVWIVFLKGFDNYRSWAPQIMYHIIVTKIEFQYQMYANYFSGVIKNERSCKTGLNACKSMKSAINMTDHMGDNFDRVGDLPLTDGYLWFLNQMLLCKLAWASTCWSIEACTSK